MIVNWMISGIWVFDLFDNLFLLLVNYLPGAAITKYLLIHKEYLNNLLLK